jgi:hypothetical protein
MVLTGVSLLKRVASGTRILIAGTLPKRQRVLLARLVNSDVRHAHGEKLGALRIRYPTADLVQVGLRLADTPHIDSVWGTDTQNFSLF